MIAQADARRIPLADESVHMCVTSPPYWGLRDYGLNGAGIGLEKSPEEYVANIVAVFREVWRVLRPDGTLWLNLGDSYGAFGGNTAKGLREAQFGVGNARGHAMEAREMMKGRAKDFTKPGLKPKDLVGIPWRVAFALQADGWYLRSDIIWHKPNPMPESVRDRPTKAHEYLFLLAKAPHYFYDAEAIKEPSVYPEDDRKGRAGDKQKRMPSAKIAGVRPRKQNKLGHPRPYPTRNRRDVWTIPTTPYRGAHFAAFPPALVEPCVLAGSKRGGLVLDPFCGSGTVGQVCRLHGRQFVGLDLSMKYLRELALPRAEGKQAAGANRDLPLFRNSG